MKKSMDLQTTSKTDEELKQKGWIVSGKFTRGNRAEELRARETIERQQKNGWQHIVRIVGQDCQIYRNREGGR